MYIYRKLTLISSFLIFIVPTLATADQIQNAKVSTLTVDIVNSQVSFSMEGNGGGCNYDSIRFSLETNAGKAAYSQLLAAKTSGSTIRYINYTNTSGNCVLTVVSS